MLFWGICHHELRMHYIVIISLVFQLPVTFSTLLIFSMIFSHTHPSHYPVFLALDCFHLTPYSTDFAPLEVLIRHLDVPKVF